MTAALKNLSHAASEVRDIADAINKLSRHDIEQHGAWQPLAELSSNTVFDGIDTSLDSVVVREDGQFEAVADVYVTLNYGPADDGALMGDAYPATIRGSLHEGNVNIMSIDIDTGSFYD